MAAIFNKWHYTAIAMRVHDVVIQNSGADDYTDPDEILEPIKQLVGLLCSDFALDNPRFNREKFMTACGLKENDAD